MKMIWFGLKIKENYHVLANQFHGNFHSKTLGFTKFKSVFRDVKWRFNALWGLKGLIVHDPVILYMVVLYVIFLFLSKICVINISGFQKTSDINDTDS